MLNPSIQCFQVGKKDNRDITHLQFADDTLVFCELKDEQVLVLRVIFIIFEVVSGLHANWGKSFIYPIYEVVQLEHLADLGGK